MIWRIYRGHARKKLNGERNLNEKHDKTHRRQTANKTTTLNNRKNECWQYKLLQQIVQENRKYMKMPTRKITDSVCDGIFVVGIYDLLGDCSHSDVFLFTIIFLFHKCHTMKRERFCYLKSFLSIPSRNPYQIKRCTKRSPNT